MEEHFEKEQFLLDSKKEKSKLGMSRYSLLTSVSFNPITCNYDPSERGHQLAQSDAEARHRVAIRAARLYAKNNSFHPILCVDVPKDIVENNSTNIAGVKSIQKQKFSNKSEEHPTASHLAHFVEACSKSVKDITGVAPEISSVASLAQKQLVWSRHY
jgi:hypothetical protein